MKLIKVMQINQQLQEAVLIQPKMMMMMMMIELLLHDIVHVKRTSLSEQIGEPSPTTRRHSSRKIVKQTKSNISSMCKFKFNLQKTEKITF